MSHGPPVDGHDSHHIQKNLRHFYRQVPAEPLIRLQKDVDTAFATMQKFKTTEIVKMMNTTPVLVKTTNTETDTVNNFEITKNPDQWINWFVAIHIKYKNKQIVKMITQEFAVCAPAKFETSVIKETLATTILLSSKIPPHRLKDYDIESKHHASGQFHKFIAALSACVSELEGSPDSVWVHGDTPGVSTLETRSGISFAIKQMPHNEYMAAVADHRFEQHINCRKITRAFKLQPVKLEISLEGSAITIDALVYPRSKLLDTGGLLVGRMQPTNGITLYPIKPTVIETNEMTVIHDKYGCISEDHAASLMTGYTRKYRKRLVEKYVATHILRDVISTKTDLHDIPPLQSMTENDIYSMYNKLKTIATTEDIAKCKQVSTTWKQPYILTCTGGTVDCFQNDSQHTDMALHTNNIFEVSYNMNEKPVIVCGDIPVSMYATYYTGGTRGKSETPPPE